MRSTAARAKRSARCWLARCLLASVGVVGAPLAAASVSSFDRAELVRLAESVVRVEADRSGGGLAIGSAVTVAPGIVVTNCHVTREASAIKLSGRGRLWRVEGQYPDELHDLCFLHAPEWTGRPVPLADGDAVRLGQKVVALGYTGGAAIAMRAGQVRALHRHEGTQVIESDTAFTSGASGGGLFDGHGALIGLLTFRSRHAVSHYYSVPASWIRERLAAINPGVDPWSRVAPLSGAEAFWQGSVERLPYFLRIGVFEADERWAAILDACRYWVTADPRNPEPFVARGRSYQHLGYPLAAIEALNAALRHAPDHARAWYELGLVHAGQGDDAGVERVRRVLGRLDALLAERLRLAAANTLN